MPIQSVTSRVSTNHDPKRSTSGRSTRRRKLRAELLEDRRLLATLTVDVGGGADFTTIGDAIGAASPGDTIEVAAGTYTENVVIDVEDLSVEGDDGAMIVALDSGSPVVEITADEVELEGFDISGGSDGVVLTGVHEVEVKENDIHDNTGDGVFVDSESTGNSFEENEARGNGDDGFDVEGDDNDLEENNSVDNGDGGSGDNGFEINGDRNKFDANVAENNNGADSS